MIKFLKKYGWMIAAGAVVIAAAVILIVRGGKSFAATEEPSREPLLMYDIPYEQYELVEGEVGRNEPMGKIFEKFGIGPSLTYRIEQACKDSFDLRAVRAGNRYVAFLERDTARINALAALDSIVPDSLCPRRLAHFVYVRSLTDYFVISLPTRDSIVVRNGRKPIRSERQRATAEITSSMWNAIAGNGYPLALAIYLEEIYGWSVDFFGIQPGDSFDVIYEQEYVDSVRINDIGRIWGAVFYHGGKPHYAIPFKQDDKISYWDENGNSLRKQFLKAPLKYTRISSRFSNARMHPILRTYRPHHAVDYAAPSGTPVHAVADGVVTRRGWDSGGGGNTMWIRHARGFETGYLHLRGYADGMVVGKRVSQGQTIGYVGSTGRSTGPHLDYRIRVNGKPMDPLKIPQEPGIPIKEANYAAFAVVRAKILGELADTLPASERLVQFDSIAIPSTPLEEVKPSAVDTTRNFIDGVRGAR